MGIDDSNASFFVFLLYLDDRDANLIVLVVQDVNPPFKFGDICFIDSG